MVDLYYYFNKNDYYFIDQGDGILRELKNEDIEFTANGRTYTKKSNEYKGSLKALFMNAPEIVEQVDHTKLNHNALIEITQDYHTAVCTDEECLVYQKEPTKSLHRIGLVTGINNFNFATAPDNGTFIADVPNERLLLPSLGIYYSTSFPQLTHASAAKVSFSPFDLGLSLGFGLQFPYTKTRDMAINIRHNREFLITL